MKSSTAFLIIAFLVFTPAACWAADTRDGNWWNELPAAQRVAWAVGFLDGLSYAQTMFAGAALEAAANPTTGRYDKVRAAVAASVEKRADALLTGDLGNVTAGNLAAGLNHIFADYRNARISVLDAMIVVARSLNGMPDDQVEKMLEGKRSGATAAFK